ncbi:hypothetical protein [Microbacterium oleivorans]|uniref:Uncharacterized protein n=1 Tax=Microbacterium oleivorans TaxID=273677 RepID=A0A7D5F6I3_9MICO|nr:hypothetical protein [Microbacterium oleivorans]QLD11373.1 hypothetical protein HW566_06045 [Microbacterium oleivorans]
MMGAGLALQAFAVADRVGLGHPATRLYVYMATVAIDSDAAPAFWGGRDALAQAIGKSGGAGHSAVKRAIQELTTAELITADNQAHRGMSARYLMRDGAGSSLTPKGDRSTTPLLSTLGTAERSPSSEKGDRSATERGPLTGPKGTAHRSPEEEEEKEEELRARATPTLPLDGLDSPAYPTQCEKHQNGPNSSPCFACGEARKDHARRDGAARRRARPAALKHRIIDGRRVCDNRPHVPTRDGSCINCEIRPDDLTLTLTPEVLTA